MENFVAARVAEGFSYPECPRWHDGAFYFSDIFAARIIRIDHTGCSAVVLDVSDRAATTDVPIVTAGFGFLPDGRLVVNSMFERVVLAFDGANVEIYADLRAIAPGPINDMVIDSEGRVYVTQLGYNLWNRESVRQTPILLIEPDGSFRELSEAGPLTAANGIAISADGRQVVVAEPPNNRLVALDRRADGTLSQPRTFALLDLMPDGVCMDLAGAVWVGVPRGGGALRVRDGGEVVAKVHVPSEEAGRTVACVLGGENRTTLYICCGFEAFDFQKSVSEGRGSIWTAEVVVPAGSARP